MKIKKRLTPGIFILLVLFPVCARSGQDTAASSPRRDSAMIRVHITAGSQTFTAFFYDNEAARALVAKMPLTVAMTDLNRNEKYAPFPATAPSAAGERPSVIRAGEIMLWTGSTLVLFYDTFNNSYGGYVRLGYIEDTTRLAETLGAGNVTLTFTVGGEAG